MYGSETWSLKKADTRRLEAIEMWVWRRIENIKWTERITNETVLQRVGEKRELITTIIKRKKNWIGHVLRGGGLVRDVIEGRMEGKKPRGRRRFGMLEELKEGSYEKMKRRAQDRDAWRRWIPRTCLRAENP